MEELNNGTTIQRTKENEADKIKSIKKQVELDKNICFDIIQDIFERLQELIEVLK